jgi:hypothetical protein
MTIESLDGNVFVRKGSTGGGTRFVAAVGTITEVVVYAGERNFNRRVGYAAEGFGFGLRVELRV